MGSRFFDKETGEVMEEPDFVKLYIINLCNAKGVSGRQADIFHFMLMHMNDHNEVSYSKASKDRFIKKQGTSNATFNNNVKALITNNLIERINKGNYRINPKYATKVEWSKVQKITWTTEFTKKGAKEKVDFS